MANATLRRLVTEYAVDQEAWIDDLVNSSGILQTAYAFPSTHGSFHKYKKVTALPTSAFRAMGGTYTTQTVNEEAANLDLKLVGIAESEEKAICEEIGVSAYFKSQRPAIIESLGQKMAKGIVYGTNASYGDTNGITGWHEFADAHGSDYYTDGGGGSSTTSIFIVKYKPGQTGLVFNREWLSAGNLIQTTLVDGGKLVFEYGGSSGTVKPVYQALYETQMAFVAGSTKCIHAIVGVNASNCPTAAEINAALDSVKYDANTYIYTSRMGRRTIWTLKDSNMYREGRAFDDIIESWNGVPVIVDDNISEAETLSNLPYGLS